MKETNSLTETKRKNKILEKRESLREEKFQKYSKKAKEKLGKKSKNDVKILNELGEEEDEDFF